LNKIAKRQNQGSIFQNQHIHIVVSNTDQFMQKTHISNNGNVRVNLTINTSFLIMQQNRKTYLVETKASNMWQPSIAKNATTKIITM